MIHITRPPYRNEGNLVDEIEIFLTKYEDYISCLSPQGVQEMKEHIERIAQLVEEIERSNPLNVSAVTMLSSIKLQCNECARFMESLKEEEMFGFAVEYTLTKNLALVQTELETYLVGRTDYRGLENSSFDVS